MQLCESKGRSPRPGFRTRQNSSASQSQRLSLEEKVTGDARK
jgi:hypothetical protein